MDTSNPAAEWQRLEEVYRQKEDAELELIADEAYDLTDIARQVLEREIGSRGLKIRLRIEPEEMGEDESEPEYAENEGEECDPATLDLVRCNRVWDKEEATKIKQAYEEAGIPAYLGPDLVENVEDYKGSFEDGVEFQVRDVDVQRARALLTWLYRDEPEDKTEYPDADFRCPKCKSDEIVFEDLEKETPDQPDFQSKFNWRCEACGHEWIDDGVVR